MEYFAYSKINLGLDVTGVREDGYHLLRMIMQTLKLRDVVDIEIDKSDEPVITMTCSDEKLSTGDDNLCVKAAKLIMDEAHISAHVKIHLTKNIPMAAGLAGGSADAAAVLEGLNDMLNLKMTQDELMQLGVKIGSDVPFCIMKGTAYAGGIGERLQRLRGMVDYPIVIAKPFAGVSTAMVYKSLDIDKITHPDIDELIKAIDNGDIISIVNNMGNVLEEVTIPMVESIDKIKDIMISNEALGAMMSGSGTAVFGIFEDEAKADKALSALKQSALCDRALITYVYNVD